MKSGQETFDDALGALFTLGGRHPTYFQAYNGVLAWLAKQTDERAARGRIGSMISLGFHWRGSPAIAERRNVTRALLLVMATHFGASQRELDEVKQRMDELPDSMSNNIRELLELANIIGQGTVQNTVIQSIVYSQATRLGTASIQDTLILGREKAIALVNEACRYTRTRGRRGEKFVRWFGDLDDSSVNTVRENLQQIGTALQTKPIDFDARATNSSRGIESGWASATRQRYEQFQKQTHIRINLAEYFFDEARTGLGSKERNLPPGLIDVIVSDQLRLLEEKGNVKDAFFADVRRGADPSLPELLLRRQQALIEQDMAANMERLGDRKKPTMISAAGVIIHETSHNVVGTKDVTLSDLTMYGRNLCGWLARHHPDLTIENADSYRLFCEECDD